MKRIYEKLFLLTYILYHKIPYIFKVNGRVVQIAFSKNEKTAEEQVVQVLNFDIHLTKDFKGKRYVERITECIPIEEKNEYTFDYRNEKTLESEIRIENLNEFKSITKNYEEEFGMHEAHCLG